MKTLLNSDIQEFIEKNWQANPLKLALQKNPFQTNNWSQIINQIACKAKAKDKLPTFFGTKNIIYPNKISLEQTSSEKTALYKSQLISGESLIDLTGGFGIDDYYFSKQFKEVIHCEQNEELSKIVSHNFSILNVKNCQCLIGDSFETLKKINTKFDCIYIDPSRRNDAKGKVFMLNDCLPNVSELQDYYFDFSDRIMIKTAPILDISAGLSELKNVKEIHIVAIDNEVKELLWIIEKNYTENPIIKTINYSKKGIQLFDFQINNNLICLTSLPKKYIYEPNSAILKSGGFNQICLQFQVYKLHKHSHLYTSESLLEFPGRIFEVEKVISYSKTDMKLHLSNTKANITTRNFPDSVDAIRKKWNIKDGGKKYCFFTTDEKDNKIVLLCKKI